MSMYLMTFDEACKTCREAYPMSANFINESLLGIEKESIPWCKKVEVDINTKLLLDRGYIKLDSIYFDMNKENKEEEG